MQPCNMLAATRIDRLARSMKDRQDIGHELKGRTFLCAQLSRQWIRAVAGKPFLDMPDVFTEFDTNLRCEF